MTWSLFFAIMLFLISIISVVLENLTVVIPFLSILPTLINSSSGFLSVLCVIAIIVTFWKCKDGKIAAILPITFYILDLAVINKLYLNATWPIIAKWFLAALPAMRTWNWPIIVITAFCLVVAATMLAWGIHIWKKETTKKEYRIESVFSVQRNMSEPQPSPHAIQLDSDGESESPQPPIEDSPTRAPITVSTDEPANSGTGDPPSLAYGLVCILLIIPVVASIQYVFYRILPLVSTVPIFVSEILDILLYLSTICVGLVIVLLLWIAKRQMLFGGKTGPLRRPAVLALILEILLFILFFFNAGSISTQFLNSFLNNVTNNALVALVIVPIVLFVMLDIGISLFMNVFFGNISGETCSWQQEAHEKLVDIQRRIVIFVLNIFLGILNLFLFIPDFFNEIGSLLLSEDDLFPKFDRKQSEPQLSPNPSKTPDPAQTSEDRGIPDPAQPPEDQETPDPAQPLEDNPSSKTD